jgi:hypothetical protein
MNEDSDCILVPLNDRGCFDAKADSIAVEPRQNDTAIDSSKRYHGSCELATSLEEHLAAAVTKVESIAEVGSV